MLDCINQTLENNTFISNESPSGGGITINKGSNYTVKDSIFQKNNVSKNGGAMFIEDGSKEVTL